MYDVQDVATGFTIGLIAGILATKWLKPANIKQVETAAKVARSIMDSNFKMVFVVRMDLNMGKGKVAAQCSHAALGAYKKALEITPDFVAAWEATGQTKIVVKLPIAPSEDENKAALYALNNIASKEYGLASIVIRDAGHTQVKGGSATVLAIGPAPDKVLNELTGHLKLL